MSYEDDLKSFEAKMLKALDTLTNKESLKALGDIESAIIKKRSRLGYGVPKDLGPKQKFKELAASTVKSRKKKNLAPETTPKKSNLTESGQLLNDLVSSVKGTSTVIGHSKNRNKEIGAFHQTGGGNLPQRRYLGLASEDLKQLKAQMQDKFTDILNKLFK